MSPNPFSPVGQGASNPVQVNHYRSMQVTGQRNVNFEISRKKNENLKIFKGSLDDYDMWHDRQLDQISQQNPMWKTLIEYLEVAPERITRAWLSGVDCLDANGWELSVTLENYLVSWISDSLYKKRKRLCGGEAGNGFELWRTLRCKYKGKGNAAIEESGICTLHNFPKCDKVANLGEHLDAWEDVYQEFGEGLNADEPHMMAMFKKILPNDILDEIIDRPDIRTYNGLLAFCRRRTDHREEHLLTEHAKKRIMSKTRLSVMQAMPDEEREPEQATAVAPIQVPSADDLTEMIASLVKQGIERGRSEKGKGKGKGRNGSRDGSRERGVGGKGNKFIWDGSCWHCKLPDHKRDKCSAYAKILADNGGKQPEGYMGAYQKAKKAFQEARKSAEARKSGQAHMKPLTEIDYDDNTEDEASDSDDGSERRDFGFAMVTKPCKPQVGKGRHQTCTRNSFSPLTTAPDSQPTSDGNMDQQTMDHLNHWAHKVHVKTTGRSDSNLVSNKVKPNKLSKEIEINSERELDRALAQHSHLMAAMPCDRKKILKASKKMPISDSLTDGECWAMMDSGAGTPGICVRKHCPELLGKLRAATQRIKCVMANGTEIVVDQEIDLEVELDGRRVPVTFSELPVSCPILSVRRIVRRGNKVVFDDDGGYILHKATGNKMRFVEREGVYFIKMKIVTSPDSMDVDPLHCKPLNSQPDFGRHGK